MGKSLANPKFTYKIYNNIFSGIRAKKDKSLNDLTKQTLLDLYNTNTKISETLLSFQPEQSPITEDIIKSANDFINSLQSAMICFSKVLFNKPICNRIYDKTNMEGIKQWLV